MRVRLPRALRLASVAALVVLGAACSDEGGSEATTPTGLTAIGGPADVATVPATGSDATGGTPSASGGAGSATAPSATPAAGGSTSTSRPAGASSSTTAPGASGPATTAGVGSTVGSADSSTSTAAVPSSSSTSTTVARSTTTVPAIETLPPTTAAPSSGPCDIATVVADTETDFDGITPRDLHCSGPWAAWVGAANDPTTTDSFFAVASWDGDTWVLANLGTAGVCTDAGVPASLWPALGCTE